MEEKPLEKQPNLSKSKRSTAFLDEMLKHMEALEHEILEKKGQDYTQGSDNRIQNFEQVAEQLGLTPAQVWYVYFYKHIDAIKTYIKTGRVESEKLIERIADARNYLALFRQILEVHDKEAL